MSRYRAIRDYPDGHVLVRVARPSTAVLPPVLALLVLIVSADSLGVRTIPTALLAITFLCLAVNALVPHVVLVHTRYAVDLGSLGPDAPRFAEDLMRAHVAPTTLHQQRIDDWALRYGWRPLDDHENELVLAG